MIKKIVIKGVEAQKKLKQGIDLVADIVKTTLSPKGRNVIVEDLSGYPPRSLNDGYYIAQNIKHQDPIVNMGATLLKRICKKTNDEAGDGTTSTAILSQALIDTGLQEISKGKNPVDVKKEMQVDLELAITELKKQSIELKNNKEIESIATVAGNSDPEIGKAFAEIYEKIGYSAAVEVEKTTQGKLITEVVNGLYFHRGYKEFVGFVNNPRQMSFEHENVRILCVDKTLNSIDDLLPLVIKMMKGLEQTDKVSWDLRLLIISNEITIQDRIIEFLAENNQRAINKMQQKVNLNGKEVNQTTGFYCCAIDAPMVGDEQSQILEDIAIATGGVCVNKSFSPGLREIDPELVLGIAKKVKVEKTTTTIITGDIDKTRLDKRIEMLKGMIEQEHSKPDKEKLQDRLNILTSGVGIIKVHGNTELERDERKVRIEDAKLAVKSAIEEGYCIGGGNTYLKLSEIVKTPYLKNACLAIPRQIAINSGRKQEGDLYNYNALTDKFEDLREAGIYDSTKVIRVALEGAVSFAGLFLTTYAAISEKEVKNDT